jgi:hypothetical protein
MTAFAEAVRRRWGGGGIPTALPATGHLRSQGAKILARSQRIFGLVVQIGVHPCSLLNSQFALNLLQRNPLGLRQKFRNHDQLQGHHQGKEREGVAA